jgi:hypothetical protein
MQFARTVDAETDQETVFLEKCGPFFVEKHAIGLQVVFDALTRPCVLFLQRDRATIKIEAAQRRFAALPREHHLRSGRARDILSDEQLERLLAHPPRAGAVGQRFLAQVEAVLAVEVAA